MSFIQILVANLPPLLEGMGMTLLLTLAATLLSWVVGLVTLATQLSDSPFIRIPGRLYISLMRGTPALIQLFVIFFTLPLIGLGGLPMLAAILALGLNSAAYVAEILRANTRVVGIGQIEAARAIGLSPFRTWTRIRLPQLLRASLPALINEFTILLKTTPLASVVAVTELTYAGQLVIARTFESTTILLATAAGYLLIALPILLLAKRLGLSAFKQAGGRA